MTTDSSQPIAQGPRPEWTLPEIVGLEIRQIDFQPRRGRYVESALARYREAIEFIVRTAGPIPIRALGPALFIGEERVIESEQLEEDTYRFLAFEIENLEHGAPIRWGWLNDQEEQLQETEYRFEL